MSFWAGLARGFADADAKKEREAVRAEAAEARKGELTYRESRDAIADARYDSEKKTALDLRLAENRKWKMQFDQGAETLKENRAWREKQAEQAQANLETTWQREDKYNDKNWAHTMDKWAFTKDQAKEAKVHADKLFTQTIKAYEYGKDQDIITNLRRDKAEARQLAMDIYQKERDLVGDAEAKLNRDDRLKQFEFQVKRAGVSDTQWQASFDMKVEERDIARTTQLLSMMPAGTASALGGSGGKTEVMSSKAMSAASPLFKAEFANLSDKDKESDFFKAAANSEATQATLMGFIEAQAEKNNNVSLADLPKYFKYVGSVEGRGQAEAKEFVANLMSGDENVSDKDSFIKGLMTMKNLRPTKELFRQIGTPTDLKDVGDKLKYWETAIETDAYKAMDKLPPADKEIVDNALASMQHKETRVKGLRVLASYNFGKDAIAEHNMGEIGVIKGYYGSDDPTSMEPTVEEPVVETPTVDLEDELEKEALGGNGATSFNTVAEAEAARAEGFSGPAYIGGVYGEIPPLEGEANVESSGSWLMRDEPLVFDKTPSYDGSSLVKREGESAADYQSRTNPEVDIEDEFEKEFGNASESDEMLNGEVTEEAVDLTDAPRAEVQSNILDIVESMPPRVPGPRRKEWIMDEFAKKFTGSSIPMDEVEAVVDQLLSITQ